MWANRNPLRRRWSFHQLQETGAKNLFSGTSPEQTERGPLYDTTQMILQRRRSRTFRSNGPTPQSQILPFSQLIAQVSLPATFRLPATFPFTSSRSRTRLISNQNRLAVSRSRTHFSTRQSRLTVSRRRTRLTLWPTTNRSTTPTPHSLTPPNQIPFTSSREVTHFSTRRVVNVTAGVRV